MAQLGRGVNRVNPNTGIEEYSSPYDRTFTYGEESMTPGAVERTVGRDIQQTLSMPGVMPGSILGQEPAAGGGGGGGSSIPAGISAGGGPAGGGDGGKLHSSGGAALRGLTAAGGGGGPEEGAAPGSLNPNLGRRIFPDEISGLRVLTY